MNSIPITTPPNLIRPAVQLVGEDGNAFAVMGAVAKALRQAGNSSTVIAAYREQATAGDYDHLLRVSMAFAEVE